MTDIEQQRRDFMRDHPDLYRYVIAKAIAAALDAAGDAASGAQDGHGAANRIWRMSGEYRARANVLRMK